MGKFLDVLIINFRKSILPIITLAIVTVAVQMTAYGFTLKENNGYELVPFMSDKSMEFWNNIGLASMIIGVALIIIFGREKDNSISIVRNLPVKRSTLWIAKFTQVSLSILLVYCANYCAMYFQYMVYQNRIHEKFRTLFVFDWDNTMLRTFFVELIVFIVVGVIITIVYYAKNYSIKAGKGGRKNEKN